MVPSKTISSTLTRMCDVASHFHHLAKGTVTLFFSTRAVAQPVIFYGRRAVHWRCPKSRPLASWPRSDHAWYFWRNVWVSLWNSFELNYFEWLGPRSRSSRLYCSANSSNWSTSMESRSFRFSRRRKGALMVGFFWEAIDPLTAWMASLIVCSTAVMIESSRRSATWPSASVSTMSWKAIWSTFKKTACFYCLRLIHGFSGLFLRFRFLRCCFPSVYDAGVIRRRFHCWVVLSLSVRIEKLLKVFD